MNDPAARITLESHRLRLEKLEEFVKVTAKIVMEAEEQIKLLALASEKITKVLRDRNAQ